MKGVEVFLYTCHFYLWVCFSPVSHHMFPVESADTFVGNHAGMQINITLKVL